MALHQRHERRTNAGARRRGGPVLAVTFVFFARGWIGGGDAKLAAATALWLGFDHLLVYLLYASIFGGVLTLAMIRFRLMPLPQALAEQEWVKRLHRLDGGVPYGIALAAAALLIYPDTTWMQPRLTSRRCRSLASRRRLPQQSAAAIRASEAHFLSRHF